MLNTSNMQQHHTIQNYKHVKHLRANQTKAEIWFWNIAREIERDNYLKANGLTVLRFWNNEVFQKKEAVLLKLWEILH